MNVDIGRCAKCAKMPLDTLILIFNLKHNRETHPSIWEVRPLILDAQDKGMIRLRLKSRRDNSLALGGKFIWCTSLSFRYVMFLHISLLMLHGAAAVYPSLESFLVVECHPKSIKLGMCISTHFCWSPACLHAHLWLNSSPFFSVTPVLNLPHSHF